MTEPPSCRETVRGIALHLIATAALIALLPGCSTRDAERSGGEAPSVRVCIGDGISAVDITLQPGAVVQTSRGLYTVSETSRLACSLRDNGSMSLTVGSRSFSGVDGVFRCWNRDATTTLDIDGRQYTDTLLVASDGRALFLVNILPVERYLESVVPNEIGRNRKDNELEAVKAQAVIARTYTMMKIDLPLRRLFDVYADARDQVYTGTGQRSDLAARAVRDTRGLVLTYEGKYAECYFHSTCGGHTDAVSLIWKRPQSKPYLMGMSDSSADGAYCSISPTYRWTELYTRSDLEALLRTYLPSADESVKASDLPEGPWTLVDLRILDRMPSGRVSRLKIVMQSGTKLQSFVLEGDRIRWALRRSDASTVLRSTLFDLDIQRDASRRIVTVRINGGGNGHGIGLCQWGAIGRARSGIRMPAILKAYFPGTALARAW